MMNVNTFHPENLLVNNRYVVSYEDPTDGTTLQRRLLRFADLGRINGRLALQMYDDRVKEEVYLFWYEVTNIKAMDK